MTIVIMIQLQSAVAPYLQRRATDHSVIHSVIHSFIQHHRHGCLGGTAIRRRTRDRKVTGLTPDQGTINSTRSTQPSIPPG